MFFIGISGGCKAVGAIGALLCVNWDVADRAASPLLLLDAYVAPKVFKAG